MDSVSQAALGAAVGVVVMGRTRPVWQSALSGAVIGTLPDLDVFIDKGDAVRDMVLHRAETHAFFWQALAAPLLALPLAMATGTRALYLRWCLMVLLGLVTHAALDAMTVYGTRIGLPFTDRPFGLGSLFIIDPLYTLPLLIGLVGALAGRGPARYRWAIAGLALSTLYAGWSVTAQAYVRQKVMATPVAAEVPADRILVTPTPFNTLLWRIVVLRGDHYHEGFYSLLDPWVDPDRPIRFAAHDRGRRYAASAADFAAARLLRDFTGGFYALSDDGRQRIITDLRMGQHPYFAFAFAFAVHRSAPLRAIEPIRISRRLPVGRGLAWLRQRALGADLPPPR